jgi:hypothetical protein
MVSGAMRRNVSVAFSHFLLGRSPRIVVGCGFFFLEAGGFQFSVFQNCHLQVFFYSFFFAQSSLSSVAEAPGYFSVSSTRSPGCFSAADVSGKGMFFMVFSPKAFPQEVEMDIHRNAHGKSRLKCFSVPVSLLALAVSSWWVLSNGCRLSRSMTDDVASDLGLLAAYDRSWRACYIMVSSARQYATCAV